jgi:hypothetical protein
MSFHRHLTITIETQEDSTIIKTYPKNIKPKNQSKKGDVCNCSREKRVCTHLAKGQHAYVHDYQEKTRVYVSKYSQAREKAKKIRLRVNRGFQEIIQQETQYKQEQSKEKNTPNPKNKFYH